MSYDGAFIISNKTVEEWQLLKVYFFYLQSYKYQKNPNLTILQHLRACPTE